MGSILDLAELENEDEELVPDIVPVDAKLAFRGPVAKVRYLFQRAAAVSPTKETVPGTAFALLRSVAATVGRVAHVSVQASDGNQSVTVAADGITVLMAGHTLLPAKKVFDILKLCPEDEVRIEVTGTYATIRSGRAVWTVQTPTGVPFAAFPDPSGVIIHPVPSKPFISALERARSASGTGNGRPALAQILLRNGQITACDGGRLHRTGLDGLSDALDTAIPNRVADELLTSLKNNGEDAFGFGHNDNTLFFEIGDDTITAHRLMLPFPDVESLLLSASFSAIETLDVQRDELKEAVIRVRVNADPDYAGVFLTVLRDAEGVATLAVSAKDKVGNASQEIIACEFDGKSRELCLNHHYLLDFLQAYPEQDLHLKLGKDTKTSRSPIYAEATFTQFAGFVQQSNPLFMR